MILKQKILFSKEECDSIIWKENTKIANWDKKDRKYKSQSILYGQDTKWIFDRLKIFFEEETNIKIRNLKETIHFHQFNKDDWFSKHNDEKEGRLFSVGVLLNDEFEGGDFLIYTEEEKILDKITGNAYIFDVKLEHEILPIINKTRYSLIWFLQYNNLNFNKKELF
jgi:hypothetical protein